MALIINFFLCAIRKRVWHTTVNARLGVWSYWLLCLPEEIPFRRLRAAVVKSYQAHWHGAYLTNTLWKSSITLDIKDSLVPDNVWYQRIFMSSVMLDFRDSETWTTMLSKAYNVVVGPTIYGTHRILYNRSLPCCDFFFRMRHRMKIWSLHNLPHLTFSVVNLLLQELGKSHYTVAQKIRATFILTITKANVDHFHNLFTVKFRKASKFIRQK